eukprot:CAMPEP_0185169388 /NCGR_PEP_ID=MMETSP1139-20130426/17195_1 /TAXON_ID=298111 /ORGANISM="Pavlova sp., Strain CCMP459" /LENGTH=69 /DNA_ID=CAMNT_0027734923 /DNA_START=504 /DNA_END=713 /DNA_ORIENTATION=-
MARREDVNRGFRKLLRGRIWSEEFCNEVCSEPVITHHTTCVSEGAMEPMMVVWIGLKTYKAGSNVSQIE